VQALWGERKGGREREKEGERGREREKKWGKGMG